MPLLLGDCLDKLRIIPSNCIDSVVTDPPYGISFMGKKWDYSIPSVEVWKEVLRVLKPGGHILVACGTRTQHRMAVNIEDAGFGIRDTVVWVYGSGFPKSMNLGKVVDKLLGNTREIVGERQGTYADIKRDKNTGQDGLHGGIATERPRIVVMETRGSSEWEGWGTALKPAVELWTLARKPLSEKTVTENVLKWGTGGINIDASRVESSQEDKDIMDKKSSKNSTTNYSDKEDKIYGAYAEDRCMPANPIGRFPSNFVHDGSDEVLDLFPYTKSSVVKGDEYLPGKVAEGSASRFFYCAKASKSERGEGNDHPTVKPVKLMKYLVGLITPEKGRCLDPFMGSGTTGVACKAMQRYFIGIEKDEHYFNIAKKRVNDTDAEEAQ